MGDAVDDGKSAMMSDVAATPRKFWQIHLSTAVVAMLCCGLFLYANMSVTICDAKCYTVGWPYIYGERPRIPGDKFIDYYRVDSVEREMNFIFDLLIGGLIVGSTMACSEYFIRRRTKP